MNLRLIFAILAASAAICGCAGQPGAPAGRSQAAVAASIAVEQIGVPYLYGGSNQHGFDCSGLVQYAYTGAGIQVERTTSGLWESLKPVTRDELRVGDILFFDIAGKISHVGIYVGKGQFVHAPSSGRTVGIEDLDSDYYKRAFVRAGRALPHLP